MQMIGNELIDVSSATTSSGTGKSMIENFKSNTDSMFFNFL